MLWDSVTKDLEKEDVNSTEWEKIVEHQETRRQVIEKAEKNCWRGPPHRKGLRGRRKKSIHAYYMCGSVTLQRVTYPVFPVWQWLEAAHRNKGNNSEHIAHDRQFRLADASTSCQNFTLQKYHNKITQAYLQMLIQC